MDLNLTSILIGGKNSDRNILTHIGPCDEREKTDMFYKVKQRGSRRNQPQSFFGFLGGTGGRWDLSSPTRDRTHAPCTGSLES